MKELEYGNKSGLVLAGGGAKGCYHVGAWQAFEEMGIHFDGVTGTSIGALVGCFYASGNIEAVTDFVMGMNPTQIAVELFEYPKTIKEKVRTSKSILEFLLKYKDDRCDISPLHNRFDELFDYEQFKNSPIAYGCMTYNDTRSEARAFIKDEITRENAHQIIMASCAAYPAFPKVPIDGEIYMDGGYADNVPIELLKQIMPKISDQKITVIDIHNAGEPVPPALNPDMFYIQPLLDPGSSMDFSTEHAHRLYNQGYLETRKYLKKNPGYLYTFLPEDEGMIQVVERYLDQSMELNEIELPSSLNAPKEILEFMLGYKPNRLSKEQMDAYAYGQIIEALALMAGIDPIALYDYRQFLLLATEGLSRLKLTKTNRDDYLMVEIFSNLKRDEITVQLHKMLVSGKGKFPAAVEKMKDRISASYTMAYVWYFMEELVKNLEQDRSKTDSGNSRQSI